MHTGGHVYAVQVGNRVKVGMTTSTATRFREYRRLASKVGVPFVELFVSPPHAEYAQNERAILNRFRPAGQRDEYLDVDPVEVVNHMRTLTFTPAPVAPPAHAAAEPVDLDPSQWITKRDAAARLRVSPATVARYLKVGHLTSARRDRTTRRILLDAAQVEQVRQIREAV